MVLGIGEGSIEIITEKQGFSAGEKIKGKVRLKLSSPKKAKGLRLRFYGERRVEHYEHGKRHTRVEQIFQQEVSLGGEKEYPQGMSEYDFELQLPSPERRQQGEGMMAGIMGFLAGDPYAHVSWYLDASLDMPMAFDINRKMQVGFSF